MKQLAANVSRGDGAHELGAAPAKGRAAQSGRLLRGLTEMNRANMSRGPVISGR